MVSQIAAGEVIERPASVVKELVENSLDAHADRIEVRVEDGGRQLIRVSDDGHGIPAAELSIAVAAHATSKVESPDELAAIGTLGFRGEALASIASVSRLRIISRAMVDGRLADAGAMIQASGDRVGEPAPAAGAPGTVIEVRDLFFNTPARRKFLRGASTEFSHISDLIARLAIAHSEVGFTLVHNERKALELPAGQDRRRRCVELLGRELEEALFPFEREDEAVGGAKVGGLAGKPELARASSKFQYLCLNGRPIRDRGLNHAIKEAYRGLIPADRHPMAVVFLDVEPEAFDVNVHPAKSEVRFHEPSRMYGLVLSALRQCLLGHDLTPGYSGQRANAAPLRGTDAWNGSPGLDARAGGASRPDGEADAEDRNAGALARFRLGGPEVESGGSPSSRGGSSARPPDEAVVSEFVDVFKRMAPSQKGFVFDEVRRAMDDPQQSVENEGSEPVPSDDDGSESGEQGAGGGVGARGDGSEDRADADPNASMRPGAAEQDSGSPASDANSERRVEPRPASILQVHRSYLVTEDDDGILIIDQHALHERMMFEQLRDRVLNHRRTLESQRLLMPTTFSTSAAQMAALESLKPLLERIGVEAEPIGPTRVAVHAFPSLLFERKVDPEGFLRELLDKAEEGDLDVSTSTALENALHEVLDMMACKAAVKAGDAMTRDELRDLLNQRARIERSSNCPHGRPTTIRLTLKDLERQFGRA